MHQNSEGTEERANKGCREERTNPPEPEISEGGATVAFFVKLLFTSHMSDLSVTPCCGIDNAFLRFVCFMYHQSGKLKLSPPDSVCGVECQSDH